MLPSRELEPPNRTRRPRGLAGAHGVLMRSLLEESPELTSIKTALWRRLSDAHRLLMQDVAEILQRKDEEIMRLRRRLTEVSPEEKF